MKKLLFFALVCAATLTANAQVISRPRVMATRNGQTTSTVVLQAGASPVFCEEYGDYVPAYHTLVREDTWVRNRDNLWWKYQNNPNYRIPWGDLYKVGKTRYKLVAPPGTVVAVQPSVVYTGRVPLTHGQPGMVMAEAPVAVTQSQPSQQTVAAPAQTAEAGEPAQVSTQPQQQVTASPSPPIRVRVVPSGQ